MPGWALPSWQFQMFSAGVWPGQSCGQGPSLCCPCSVPPGCCPGAVMEEKQSWTGGHRPSVVSLAPVPTVTRWNLPLAISGHGVRPLQLSDFITNFNSCCLQLNYPVSLCTKPSDLFGDWILTSGLHLLCCWSALVPCSHFQLSLGWCCGCAGGRSNYALSIFILLHLIHFCTTWRGVFLLSNFISLQKEPERLIFALQNQMTYHSAGTK